jgi:hypothetical protein
MPGIGNYLSEGRLTPQGGMPKDAIIYSRLGSELLMPGRGDKGLFGVVNLLEILRSHNDALR